ncbi:hypothetical protein [Pararhizobium gei]|uniref:hypothetical protein n=1 Tax=Pararhizobium gei TaxID=1395951 RepID=UPI0023DA6608|nr:hypothetical protein [Rhizobium gei]
MREVTIEAQIKALEAAIGSGGPGIWREGHQEVHRKQLEAALRTLKFFAVNAEMIYAAIGDAKP